MIIGRGTANLCNVVFIVTQENLSFFSNTPLAFSAPDEEVDAVVPALPSIRLTNHSEASVARDNSKRPAATK